MKTITLTEKQAADLHFYLLTWRREGCESLETKAFDLMLELGLSLVKA